MRRGALVLAVVAMLLTLQARADWQTRSWSRWQVESAEVRAVFGIERAELQRLGLPDDSRWLIDELRTSIVVAGTGEPCKLTDAVPASVDAARLQVRLRFSCVREPQSVGIGLRTLLEVAAAPMHYATLAWPDGRREDVLFTRASVSHDFEAVTRVAPRSGLQVAGAYLALGFEHILAGADHVAFLLCMLLVSPRFSHRLWMVTGFTLGHSITLSLSALGLLHARVAAVEALIGFTVALLAAEIFARAQRSRLATVLLALVLAGSLGAAWAGALPGMPLGALCALLLLTPAYLWLSERGASPVRLHVGMTGVFGLVHGLGFAAVLQSLGLPDGQRGWALAGFNLGVEAGQLALLLAFGVLIAAAERLRVAAFAQFGQRVLAGMLCALGVFWFVGRSMLA